MDRLEEDVDLTVCQRWWLILLFSVILVVILIAISFALFIWWLGSLFMPFLLSLGAVFS